MRILIWRAGVRRRAALALVFAVCVLGSRADAQEAERAKQVLVLNSTRLDDQFSVVWTRELPKLLSAGLKERVDFYAEYIDFVRFPGIEFESAYLDFLRLKYAGKPVDLLIVIGSPAIDFVSRHRNDVFGSTPAVFYSLDPSQRRLTNATGLVNPLHFGRSIALALALQPDLKRVYVVSGASAADQGYERQAKEEFAPFEGRVEFTYLSGLAMQDLEKRLRNLPPRSAVFYVVVRQDGAGEQFQVMAALARVASAANAPTYSWADAAVDSGIVGGSRRDQLAQTRAIATLGLRVLRGERADDIPVSSPNTDVDQVDSRQLRRWGIDASRVPTGTGRLFWEANVWDRYRRYIILAMVLMAAQAALIGTLLVQRARRRRVELELRMSYDRIRHLGRRLLGEQDAERARIARELHDDIHQQLAVLSIELDQLRSDRSIDGAPQLSSALETAQNISTSVRELSHRLHPSRLQLIGLVAQEALANAVKHSGAHHIGLDLSGGPSGVTLTITDDGRGFDVGNVATRGLGLISMRERVESVRGVLEIHATPAEGTRLQVTVPTSVTDSALAERAPADSTLIAAVKAASSR